MPETFSFEEAKAPAGTFSFEDAAQAGAPAAAPKPGVDWEHPTPEAMAAASHSPEPEGFGSRVGGAISGAFAGPYGPSDETLGKLKDIPVVGSVLKGAGAALDALGRPIQAASAGGAAAIAGGAQKLGMDPGDSRRLERDLNVGAQIAQVIAAGNPTPIGALHSAEKLNRDAAQAAAKQATSAGKASQAVERRLAQDVKATGTSAQDVIDRLTKTRDLGKPTTLMDVAGPNTQGLAGSVGRAPGESQAIVRRFLDDRDKEALTRLSDDMKKFLTDTDNSAYRTSRELVLARDQESAPLYAKAMEGGSIAPLQEQFRSSFDQATAAEEAAAKRLATAQDMIKHVEGTAGKFADNEVYIRNISEPATKAAQAELNAAMKQQQDAAVAKVELLGKLRQAERDAETGAPGAVYSPRIQQFLDDPIVKQGFARGMESQRLQALARNEAFDPTEYALNEKGEPIKVPNMKTLDAVKKGLDAIIESEGRDEYGRLNSRGRDVNAVRVALLGEVDRINPSYAAARNAWAGKSASLDALKFGRNVMRGGEHPLSVDEIADAVAKMSDSDREFARIGLADALLEKVKDTGVGGDEAKAVAKSVLRQEKMRPLFRTKEQADKFIDAVEAERQMFDTRFRIKGGSQTAERVAEDQSGKVSGALHAAHGASKLFHGNPVGAAGSFLRTARDLGLRKDPGLNTEVARLLTDPKMLPRIGPDGRLVVAPQIPGAALQPRP